MAVIVRPGGADHSDRKEAAIHGHKTEIAAVGKAGSQAPNDCRREAGRTKFSSAAAKAEWIRKCTEDKQRDAEMWAQGHQLVVDYYEAVDRAMLLGIQAEYGEEYMARWAKEGLQGPVLVPRYDSEGVKVGLWFPLMPRRDGVMVPIAFPDGVTPTLIDRPTTEKPTGKVYLIPPEFVARMRETARQNGFELTERNFGDRPRMRSEERSERRAREHVRGTAAGPVGALPPLELLPESGRVTRDGRVVLGATPSLASQTDGEFVLGVARTWAGTPYGHKQPNVNCGQFVSRVVERIQPGLTQRTRDSIEIKGISNDQASLRAAIQRKDPALCGVVRALAVTGVGRRIEPTRAQRGDVVQYWTTGKDGTIAGHAGIIERVVRTPEGPRAHLYGSNLSTGGVSTTSYAIPLGRANTHVGRFTRSAVRALGSDHLGIELGPARKSEWVIRKQPRRRKQL